MATRAEMAKAPSNDGHNFCRQTNIAKKNSERNSLFAV